MAAAATAIMAVSVLVTNPATSPASAPAIERQAFTTTASASLSSSVESWSRDNGLAAPQVDSRVASLSVGNLTVTGGNVCDAMRRLVAALKYSEDRPELVSCDAAPGGRIVVGSAQR
jgi:hypothetical protein